MISYVPCMALSASSEENVFPVPRDDFMSVQYLHAQC